MEKPVTAVSLRQTYSAEVWKARITSCRGSGKNVKTWCAENAINIHTYYRWERKLLSESGKQREQAVNCRFTELPVISSSDSGAVVAVIRVQGTECEIHSGISDEMLTRLVQAMKSHA